LFIIAKNAKKSDQGHQNTFFTEITEIKGEINMGDKGSKDKGKKEDRKKAKLNPKEKRKLKREKKKII